MRLSSHKVTFRMLFSISKKERLSLPSFLREGKRQSSASSGQVTFSGKIVLEPIREVWIHDEAFAASRLSMMRIMARRTKAATVIA